MRVDAVIQRIDFPSVLDYVRFQLLAPPMAVLLGNRPEPERQAVIDGIASDFASMSDPAMLAGGGFTFSQGAYTERLRPPS